MADTIIVKIGTDTIPGIPATLSEQDVRESLADLRPEVANYDARWTEENGVRVLEFVPRPATKG